MWTPRCSIGLIKHPMTSCAKGLPNPGVFESSLFGSQNSNIQLSRPKTTVNIVSVLTAVLYPPPRHGCHDRFKPHLLQEQTRGAPAKIRTRSQSKQKSTTLHEQAMHANRNTLSKFRSCKINQKVRLACSGKQKQSTPV